MEVRAKTSGFNRTNSVNLVNLSISIPDGPARDSVHSPLGLYPIYKKDLPYYINRCKTADCLLDTNAEDGADRTLKCRSLPTFNLKLILDRRRTSELMPSRTSVRSTDDALTSYRPNSSHQYLTQFELRDSTIQEANIRLGKPTRATLLRARHQRNANLWYSHERADSARTDVKSPATGSLSNLLNLIVAENNQPLHSYLTGARYNRPNFIDHMVQKERPVRRMTSPSTIHHNSTVDITSSRANDLRPTTSTVTDEPLEFYVDNSGSAYISDESDDSDVDDCHTETAPQLRRPASALRRTSRHTMPSAPSQSCWDNHSSNEFLSKTSSADSHLVSASNVDAFHQPTTTSRPLTAKASRRMPRLGSSRPGIGISSGRPAVPCLSPRLVSKAPDSAGMAALNERDDVTAEGDVMHSARNNAFGDHLLNDEKLGTREDEKFSEGQHQQNVSLSANDDVIEIEDIDETFEDEEPVNKLTVDAKFFITEQLKRMSNPSEPNDGL